MNRIAEEVDILPLITDCFCWLEHVVAHSELVLLVLALIMTF